MRVRLLAPLLLVIGASALAPAGGRDGHHISQPRAHEYAPQPRPALADTQSKFSPPDVRAAK